MKIAVTYDNGMVFPHFGHTQQFKVYTVEDGKVASSQVIGSDGRGHESLVDVLKEQGVDTLICGGVGPGARKAISSAGLKLYGGVSGSADNAVAALLEGKLIFDPNAACIGHEGGHGHHEGGHGHHEGHHSEHGGCHNHKKGGKGGNCRKNDAEEK